MMEDVMSPEDYALLLQLGQQNTQDEASVQAMIQQAKMLRERGGTPGMRQAGPYSMAAHPLEFLGALANQGAAQQKETTMLDTQRGMGVRTGQQNQMVLAGLLRGMRQPPDSVADPLTPQ